MQSITVKVNRANQTTQEAAIITNDGKPTIIKAANKVNYEFINNATGRGPEKIITKRVGKDLHISFEDGGESDWIIEGFYNKGERALIGLGEDGQYHYYIPDTGSASDYVTKLANGDVEAQVLGMDSYPAPWWIGASKGSGGYAWLLGLAGLAAGVSSRGDLDKDTPTPTSAAPIETNINATSMSINESGHPVVTGQLVDAHGNVVANATVLAILTWPGGHTQTQEVQTQQDGSFEFEWAMLNFIKWRATLFACGFVCI